MIRFSLFSALDMYKDVPVALSTRYEHCLDQISYAEELGFAACWIGEHHFYPAPAYTLACPNPAIILAAAAQRTKRIGLNTAVANLPLHHPLQVAEDYAMVDVLSGGRLGFGLGRGAFGHEYLAMGQSREESQGRFEESWEIIQRAWRGENVSFQGRYYQVEGAKINVAPVQQPLPRYWFSAVRGESFATRGRAAQPILCLPHLTANSLPSLAVLAATYRQHYQAAGGDMGQCEIPLIFYTCVAPTQHEALQIGRPALQRYLAHQHHHSEEHIQQFIHTLAEHQQLWFGAPDDLIHLIEQHQAAIQNGHFVFWLDFGGMEPALVRRSLQLLGQEVIPYFNR